MPRYLEKTADQVAALGDVKYMIVTARDNADGKTRLKSLHERYQSHCCMLLGVGDEQNIETHTYAWVLYHQSSVINFLDCCRFDRD